MFYLTGRSVRQLIFSMITLLAPGAMNHSMNRTGEKNIWAYPPTLENKKGNRYAGWFIPSRNDMDTDRVNCSNDFAPG
jgi:hypothetical protein